MREHEIHISILKWLKVMLPRNSLVHHSPNEGRHHINYRMKQKRLGVQPGWPDLEIFVPATHWLSETTWAPIFLEIKTDKGKVSENQKSMMSRLAQLGCYVSVVRSVDDSELMLRELVRLNGQ